jgi:HPt (histidine-containing phosphotransfer) domain-containing protein
MKPDPQWQGNPAMTPGPLPMPDNPKSTIDDAAIARLREIAGTDTTFLKDILTAYKDDTAKRLVELRNAHAAGDTKGVKRIAHTIKGSSLNIGAVDVTASCRQLEQMADSGKPDGLAEVIARIGEESKRVETEISRILQG